MAHVRRFHGAVRRNHAAVIRDYGAVRRDHAAVRRFCLTVQRFFVAPSPFHSCTFAVFSRQNLAIFALFKKKNKIQDDSIEGLLSVIMLVFHIKMTQTPTG